MKKLLSLFVFGLLILALFAGTGHQNVNAQTDASDPHPPVNQIIVKYRDDAGANLSAQAQMEMDRLSAAAGVGLTYFRPMSGGAHVLRLPERMPVPEAEGIAKRLESLISCVISELRAPTKYIERMPNAKTIEV